jgi:hypothetical protein
MLSISSGVISTFPTQTSVIKAFYGCDILRITNKIPVNTIATYTRSSFHWICELSLMETEMSFWIIDVMYPIVEIKMN